MKVRVSNIQRFCLQDGPGIRTTIFLKGCNLKCPWCANPENINYNIQKYYDQEKQEYFFWGYDISLEQLEKEILKDEIFYSKNNGGVTFSGGEPLLQFDKLEPLLVNLKQRGINICVETALFVKKELIDLSIKYVDEYIIDMKILSKSKCRDLLNGDIEVYYNNLKELQKKNVNITIRVPLVQDYTFEEENIQKIINILEKFKPHKVEIFEIHNLAKKKYSVLNKKMVNFGKINEEEINKLIKRIKDLNINVEKIEI